MSIIQPQAIVMVNEPDREEEITLTGSNLFVPSENGETCFVFLTDTERNMLAKVLVMRSLMSDEDRAICKAIHRKLPPRA